MSKQTKLIPSAIILKGDKALCGEWVGYAEKQLRILERQMSFQKLNEGYRTTRPVPWIVVECWSSFKKTEILITVLGGKKKEEKEFTEEEKKECYCFPCFTFGVILKIRTVYDEVEYRNGKRYEYDVAICKKDLYIILENYEIRSTGWEEYYEGQYVAVSVDIDSVASEFPNCCKDKVCLASRLLDAEKVIQDCLTIHPVYLLGAMRKWFLKSKRRNIPIEK